MANIGYYAVIPANVRYAKIPDGAKLLYGEITALCNEKGYCWAGNSYFAKLYQVDIRTIKRWLYMLENKGFITRDIIYKPNSKEIDKRIIQLGVVTKMSLGGGDKNVPTPGDKNVPDNNTYINNTSVSEDTLPNKELICECEESQKEKSEDAKVQKVIDEYRKICTNLKPLKRATAGRRQKVKDRLKEYSLNEIIACFKKAAESDFMRKSPSGWTASFDWLMDSEENIAKVLEGNFENNKASPNQFKNFSQRETNIKELEEVLFNKSG